MTAEVRLKCTLSTYRKKTVFRAGFTASEKRMGWTFFLKAFFSYGVCPPSYDAVDIVTRKEKRGYRKRRHP